MLNVFDLLVVPCATFSRFFFSFKNRLCPSVLGTVILPIKTFQNTQVVMKRSRKKNHIIRLKARMWKNEQDLTFETHLALCKIFIFQLL